MRLRRLVVLGLSLSLLGIGIPAWSADDPRSCNDLLPDGTPAYVMCHWMATPEEAADIARFWLNNDGQNMESATPPDGMTVNCQDVGGNCPVVEGGDGEVHGDGDQDVEGGDDPGTPECQNGEKCYVDGTPEGSAVPGVSKDEREEAAKTPAGGAVQTATGAKMRVWLDTELADDWKAGKLEDAVKQLAPLAAQEGVVGIRFSTQLGFNQNLGSAEELDKFVAETSAALRKALPGKKLAAHTVVPVFGCGANDACRTEMTTKYPLLDPDRVGAWLAKGQIDQLALDSGTDYSAWKIDTATAQRNQWIQVRARAWDAYGQIAAEDAGFTAPNASQLTEEQATKSLTDRVATPLQDAAASSVILWSRWQDGQGQIHRIYGEKWAANTTWDQLKKLSAVRARLTTIYDPASPEVDAATDLKNLSAVFGQVIIHV
ncbi:MAG: hypothetical protein HOY71_26545 [Nonomuraea sp.]|nr:hypothetical protein [Nonomuraea sp.]